MQTERKVDLDGRFDVVDQRFDAVDGRFDAVDGRFDAVDQRFEVVDQRFEVVDGRLEVIDGRLEGIDGRLEGIDGRLEAIDGRFDAVDRRFEETHRLIGDNSTQIRHTHVLVEDLRSDLKAIAEGVAAIHDKLDQKLDTIDSRCASDRTLDRKAHTSLRKRVDKVEGRVERLESA